MFTEFIHLIQCANPSQIEDILHAALERKRQLFPDREIVYLAMPKNSEQDRLNILNHFTKWR